MNYLYSFFFILYSSSFIKIDEHGPIGWFKNWIDARDARQSEDTGDH